MIVYDNRFDANEWFVIVLLFVGYAVVYFLPRRFPAKNAIVYGIYGVFSGFLFDHTLSVSPFNLYDVNDNSNFQVMDFLSYLSYGPFSYVFVYLFDRYQIKPSWIPAYILVWSLFALGMEWVSLQLGVFHYRRGYKLAYSFLIYLIVQSVLVRLYFSLQKFSKNEAITK